MSDEGTYYHTDPKKQKINNLVAFYITRIFSFSFFSFVLISIYQILRNLMTLEMSFGKVTAFETVSIVVGEIFPKDCRKPKVAFESRNGEFLEFWGDKNCLTGYHDGDKVLVFYDFGSYQDVQVMSISADLVFPLIALGLGLFFWKYGNWAKNYVPPTMRKDDQA